MYMYWYNLHGLDTGIDYRVERQQCPFTGLGKSLCPTPLPLPAHYRSPCKAVYIHDLSFHTAADLLQLYWKLQHQPPPSSSLSG